MKTGRINFVKIALLFIASVVLVAILSLFWTDDIRLGNGYAYFPDNKLILSTDGSGEIPSNVLRYAYNNKFIIAEQKPRENDPNAFLYDKEYFYSKGYNTNYYWLVLKKEKKIIGPLNSEQFAKQRIVHNVPEKLILK